MTIRVYYFGFFIFCGAYFGKIVEMDMAVDQVFRLKNPHKPEKRVKALVAEILPVMDAPGSGVGQEHVEETPPEQAVKEQRRNKAQNLTAHLEIGVLVVPPVIPHGAPQPGHDEPPLPDDPAADMEGAVPVVPKVVFGLACKCFQIVVPEHEQEGPVQAGNDKVQIVHGKIPGAENQVYVFKSFFYGS
jgi:hypothetical protein